MKNLKDVLRSTTIMSLFAWLFCIWMSGCENQTHNQKVDRLIRQLQDQDPNVRGNAAITLGQIGASTRDAVPALIQTLQDQKIEGFVRSNAAITLGQIGTEDGVYVLIQALKNDQDTEVRKAAAGALGAIGDKAVDAVPVLIQALNDQNRRVRGIVAYALGQIGTPEAIKAVDKAVSTLIQALKNQDAAVRANAAEVLGMAGESAVPALIQALKNQDAAVRKGAILALGSIGSEGTVSALIQALQNDQSAIVRGNAAKALDSIGIIYPEALEAVKEYRSRK